MLEKKIIELEKELNINDVYEERGKYLKMYKATCVSDNLEQYYEYLKNIKEKKYGKT